MIVNEEYFIGYQHVDRNYKLKNTALLGMFEDLACIHGNYAGENIMTSPTVWLLTAYSVRVTRRPCYGERVSVLTWARTLNGYISCREFELVGENGDKLAVGLSEWAHFEKDGLKLNRVTPELEAAYEPERERSNFNGKRIAKVREPESYQSEVEYTVRRNWIDANGHMNNVFYLDLAEATLPENVYNDCTADRFDIFYRKEIKCGETVLCQYAETEYDYHIAVRNKDKTVLHAQIVLYK